MSSGPTRGGRGSLAVRPAARGSVLHPLRVLVVGDSVSLTLAQGLAVPDTMTVRAGGILGCGVARVTPYRYFGSVADVTPQCENWPTEYAAEVGAQRPDVVALLAGRWEVMDRVFSGRWTAIGDPAYDAYLSGELDRAVDVLSSTGASVVLLTAPYYLRGERPDGGRFPEDDPSRVDRWNALLRAAAGRHPGVARVVDLGSRITPGGRYSEVVDGVDMRYDGVHMTVAGDRAVSPWLVQQLTPGGATG